MAQTTVGFGALLILLGAISYIGTGHQHPTALIPIWFGIALCLCGVLAKTENLKRRMLWMHVAVALGLFGFLAPVMRIIMGLARHAPIDRAAFAAQAGMAILMGIYIVLCVQSFKEARRQREAVEA